MASHLYAPEEPANLVHRFLAHAVEVCIAAGSLLIGVYIGGVAHAVHVVMPTSSLAVLPTLLVYAISAFITVGGVLALYGLLVRKDNIRKELNIEQMGWLMLALGWSAYLIAVLVLVTGTVIAVILGLTFGVASITRLIALVIIERDTVAVVQNNTDEGDGAAHDA